MLHQSRRFIIAVLALASLTFLGYTKDMDVALAVASIAIGLAGANAYQKQGSKDSTKSEE